MAQNQKLRDQTREQAGYLTALNQKLDQVVGMLAKHGETLAAIVDHLGEDVIQANIDRLRAKRKAKNEAEMEESVQRLVSNGLATATPDGVITETSFIVGEEVSPSGTSARIQHEMGRLDKTGQARYLGKKVGDEATEPGFPTKVVIKAIYQIDMVKVQEFAAKKKAEAAAARLAAVGKAQE